MPIGSTLEGEVVLVGLLVPLVSESVDATPEPSELEAVVRVVGLGTAVREVIPLAVVVIVSPSKTSSSFLLPDLPLAEFQILIFFGGSGQVESGYRVCRNEL